LRLLFLLANGNVDRAAANQRLLQNRRDPRLRVQRMVRRLVLINC